MVGVGLVGYYTKESHDELTKDYGDDDIDPYDLGRLGRYEFYLYTASVGIIIACLGLVCAARGFLEKKYGAMAVSMHAVSRGGSRIFRTLVKIFGGENQ